MQQVCGGAVPDPVSAADTLVYVALQELATRIAHRNTGTMLDDEAGYKVMARVAADENLHYLFYRDLVSAALEIDPSGTMLAIERQVRTFEMPGTGIPDFTALAAAIADTGIYDLALHHDQVLVPVVLRHWNVESIEGLDAEAEQARTRLVEYIARVDRVGRAMVRRRERRGSRDAVAIRRSVRTTGRGSRTWRSRKSAMSPAHCRPNAGPRRRRAARPRTRAARRARPSRSGADTSPGCRASRRCRRGCR